MNVMRTGLLLAALMALFLAIGYALGGVQGAVIALVLALGMNFFAYWNSGNMVLRMHGAREATPAAAPDLYRLVAGLAERAALPMPKVYIIEQAQPNAFATGRSPEHAAVACTTGILQVLSREELGGVIAHELAHIKNRDTLTMTIAASIAGAIGFLANFAFFFGGSGQNRPNPIALIAIMLLAPVSATLIQLGISRTREFSADALGAEISGRPRSLASALGKIQAAAQGRRLPTAERNPSTAPLFIVNPLHGGGISALFRTHPPTEERIRRLMALDAAPEPPGVTMASASTARRRGGSVPPAGGARGPWG